MWFRRTTDNGRRTTDDRKSIVFILVLLALLGLTSVPNIGDTLAVNRLAAAAAIRCGGSALSTQHSALSTQGFAKREQAAWLQAVEARCEGMDEQAVASMHDTLAASDTRLNMVRTFYPDNIGLARFAAERYPARADAYFWLGDALAQDSDKQAATEQYKQGLALTPTNADAWMTVGSLYQERGDSQEAVKAYDQACLYIDRLKNGCRQAGKLYLKMEQYELAEKRFEEGIKQLGDEWEPLERDLAAALLAQGKTEEAVPHLEILAESGSEDARQKLEQIKNK